MECRKHSPCVPLSINVCAWNLWNVADAQVVNKLSIKVCAFNVASTRVVFSCQSKCVPGMPQALVLCIAVNHSVCAVNVLNFVDGLGCKQTVNQSVYMECMECCNLNVYKLSIKVHTCNVVIKLSNLMVGVLLKSSFS